MVKGKGLNAGDWKDGETPDEFRQRIRNDGVWQEFLDLREKIWGDKEHKGVVVKTKAEAWELAAKEFGWVKGQKAVEDIDRFAGPIRKAMEGKVSTKPEDAEWVYRHLGKRSLSKNELCDAPSHGAIGLLKWARANQDKFYQNVFSKLQTMKVEGDVANTDGDEQIGLIDGLLSKFQPTPASGAKDDPRES